MAFRRFRRFRRFGRRPLVRAQRPTWIRGFDLGISGPNIRAPYQTFDANPGDAVNWPGIDVGTRRFSLFGTTGTGPGGGATTVQVVAKTEIDFFEGELSVLRMMGHLRLFGAFVSDNADGAYNNRLLEVRAWIYKSFQQDINNRVSLIHPFNGEDFDNRIVWSTSWYCNIVSGTTPSDLQGLGHLEVGQLSPAATFMLERGNATAFDDRYGLRRISTKRAIALKGNERLSLCVAAGPFPQAANTVQLFIGGMTRLLIRH